jgi:hypothetical protein
MKTEYRLNNGGSIVRIIDNSNSTKNIFILHSITFSEGQIQSIRFTFENNNTLYNLIIDIDDLSIGTFLITKGSALDSIDVIINISE